MNLSAFLLVAAIVLCTLLSAFFSAIQASMDELNRPRLKGLAFGGNMQAEKAYALMEQQERLHPVILLGGRLAMILAVSFSAALLVNVSGGSVLVLSMAGLVTAIYLISEAVPKALGKDAPEKLIMRFASVLKVLMTVLAPLYWLHRLWRLLIGKVTKPQEEPPLIEEELITMVDEAQSEGDMDEHEGELIRSAIEFTDLDARDILTPRVDVVGLSTESTLEEAANTFLEYGYSRLPVYRETMDDIVGILHEKDFYLGTHEGKTSMEVMMKPALYAPATLKITKLLQLLQSSKNHMAVILDEFGGTEGIVTLEDVLEELVGEIYDEHDDVTEAVQRQEDGSLLVDGGADLKEILELIHIHKEYAADTVGGWVAEEMGQIPKVGEGFELSGIKVQATRVWKRRVMQVRIVLPENPEDAATTVQG